MHKISMSYNAITQHLEIYSSYSDTLLLSETVRSRDDYISIESAIREAEKIAYETAVNSCIRKLGG